MLSRFLILRHGETNHNALGIIQGSSDVSRLTEKGVDQARCAGVALTKLTDLSFESTFCSPLTRARQTLDAVEESLLSPLPAAMVIDELREIDLGSWESQDKKKLQVTAPDAYENWKSDPLAFAVDGAHPVVDLWGRAAVAWKALRNEALIAGDAEGNDDSGAALVVTHNACGQALLCTALGLDATHFRRHEFENCAALELEWPAAAPTATRWRWRLGPKAEGVTPPWVAWPS